MNQNRHEKLDNYLKWLIEKDYITEEFAVIGKKLLYEFVNELKLEVPDVCCNPNNDLEFFWNFEKCFIILTVERYGLVELYYQNRENNEDFVREFRIGDEMYSLISEIGIKINQK